MSSYEASTQTSRLYSIHHHYIGIFLIFKIIQLGTHNKYLTFKLLESSKSGFLNIMLLDGNLYMLQRADWLPLWYTAWLDAYIKVASSFMAHGSILVKEINPAKLCGLFIATKYY